MTDQEAYEYFLEKMDLRVWQRLVFLFQLCIFGCYFWFPIGLTISPSTTNLILGSLVIPFIFLVLLGSVIINPKIFSALWTLRKAGYKKWRRFYWTTGYKCFLQNLKPTAQEQAYFPWLWSFTVFSFIFPIVSLIVFVASFFFLP